MSSSTPNSMLPTMSKRIEKALEYRFLADVTAELLLRGVDYDILRGEVDEHGHDIVIEVEGCTRDIQLKAMVKGGRRRRFSLNVKLAGKPSSCVVLTTYDPASFLADSYRVLGEGPGQVLSIDQHAAVAVQPRANANGVKAARPNHRVLTRGNFKTIGDVAGLVDRLFGASADQPRRCDAAAIG